MIQKSGNRSVETFKCFLRKTYLMFLICDFIATSIADVAKPLIADSQPEQNV